MVPTNLYYIANHTGQWRRAALLIHKRCGHLALHPEMNLEFRDYMGKYGLPVEGWVDFQIIAAWIRDGLPIPLATMLHYVLSEQRKDGSWSVDEIVPNSGAMIRSLELCGLLDIDESLDQVRLGLEYLEEALQDGGLQFPVPLPGALIETGTTARCLYTLSMLRPHSTKINEIKHYLEQTILLEGDFACWHTVNSIQSVAQGITGASALALHALLQVDSQHDGLVKVVHWLVQRQNPDGGWGEKIEGLSSVDNTFNVLRALNLAYKQGLSVKGIEEALEKGRCYVYEKKHLDVHCQISSLAMLLRVRLLFAKTPYDPEIMQVLDAIAVRTNEWYNPKAHYYNAILIIGLALSEWLVKARSIDNPYAHSRNKGDKGLAFMLDFPVRTPPFYQGARDGAIERLLDALVTTRFNGLAPLMEDSITFRDVTAMFLTLIIFSGVYVNSDLINAILLPNASNQTSYLIPFVSIYGIWLWLKWRIRPNTVNFFATTGLAWFLSWGIIQWLGLSNKDILNVLQEMTNPSSLWRMLLFFALFIDIGKHLVSKLQLDKIFTQHHK